MLKTIDRAYGNRNLSFYAINLKGHGSIIMSETIDFLENVEYEYIARPAPEVINIEGNT